MILRRLNALFNEKLLVHLHFLRVIQNPPRDIYAKHRFEMFQRAWCIIANLQLMYQVSYWRSWTFLLCTVVQCRKAVQHQSYTRTFLTNSTIQVCVLSYRTILPTIHLLNPVEPGIRYLSCLPFVVSCFYSVIGRHLLSFVCWNFWVLMI